MGEEEGVVAGQGAVRSDPLPLATSLVPLLAFACYAGEALASAGRRTMGSDRPWGLGSELSMNI